MVAAGGTPTETPAERALRQHRDGPGPRLIARLPNAPAALARRIPFVLGMIGLVGAGLALTLWLSTGSAENSYELTRREAVNNTLMERKAELERDVKAGQSAPGLAERATELGMVPAGTLPILVTDPRGKVAVVGTPAPATGSPKPALNPPAAAPAGSGAPGAANPGQSNGGGEQLVTMNSGTPTVANPAPAPASRPSQPQSQSRPQSPTPSAPPASEGLR